MARIIIASHGALSRGVVDSLGMVAGGVADCIETYSLLSGENPNDHYEQLRNEVSATDEQFIILCDIKGGSVHNALFRLTEFPNVVLFSGVTLGMALEIALTCQEGLDPARVPEVVEAAREGITGIVGGSEPVDDAEDEDF